MIEKEGFKIEKLGQIGNGSVERVVLETEDAKLIKPSQRVGDKNTAEI